MAVALTLAFSLKKLMDKNNKVIKMHSCEKREKQIIF